MNRPTLIQLFKDVNLYPFQYQKMKSQLYSLTYGRTAYVRTNQSFKQLTCPLINGSITAPNIRLADGSTRSYMTSAAALTCVISTFVNRRNRRCAKEASCCLGRMGAIDIWLFI